MHVCVCTHMKEIQYYCIGHQLQYFVVEQFNFQSKSQLLTDLALMCLLYERHMKIKLIFKMIYIIIIYNCISNVIFL